MRRKPNINMRSVRKRRKYKLALKKLKVDTSQKSLNNTENNISNDKMQTKHVRNNVKVSVEEIVKKNTNQNSKRGRKSGSQNSNTTTPSSPALSDSPKTTTSAPANGSRRIRKPTQKYSCGANPKDVDDIIEGRKEPKLVQNIIPNLMKTPVVVSKNGVQLLVTPPLGMLGKRAASSSPPCSAAPPAKVTSTSSLSPGAIDLQILPMSQYATMRKKSDHGNFIKPFVVKKEPSRGYSDEVKKPKIINKSQVDSKTSNMHDNSTAEVLGTVISLPSKSPLKPTILRSLVNSVGESTRVLVSTSPPSRFVNTNTNTNTNSNSINTANNITSATRVVLPKPREQSLCGMSCPGLKSVIPSLHCQICMCMFHPKCVGVETNTTNFICLNCQSTNNISGITNPANKSYKNGITKEQMLSGRIITLPETMSRRIDMNTSLQVKIEGITYNVPPNCFINSPDGSFKVLLPNSTKPHQAKMLNNRTRYINGRIQTPIISSSSSSSANTTSTTTTTTTIVQQTSLISAPTALNGGNRLAGSLTVNGTVGTGAGGAGAGGAGAIQIIANGQCSSIARSSAPILNNSMVVGGGVGGGVGGVGGVVGGANVSPRCSVVNSAQTAHTTTTNNTPNNQFSGSLQPLARAGPLILGPGSIRIVGNGNQANIGNQGNGNNNNGAAGLTISGGGMVNIATHNRPIARAHLVDNSPRIAASVRCPTQLNPTGGGHVVGGARVLPAHGHILAPGAQIIGGPRLVAGSLNGHCISSTPTLTLGTAGPVVVHQHNGVGSNAVTTSTPINILPPTANKASTASPVTARAPGVVVATPGLTIGPVIKNPVVTSGGPVIGTPVTNSASVASCNVVATAGLKIGPVIKNPTATARTSGAPTVVGTAGLTIGPVIKNPGVCSAPTGIVGTPISASPAPPVATPGLTIGPVIKNPVARPGEIIRMATVIGPPVSASSILSATPIAPPPANKPKAVVAMPLVEMTKQQLHNAVIPKKKSLTINSLDHDILRNVFSYLPVQNLSRVQCVCKKWSSIASHQKLWKKVDLRCHLLRNFDFISNYLFNRGTVTSLDIRGCGYDKAKLLDFISDFTRLQSLALNSVDSNMLEHLGKLRFFKVLYIELDNSTIVKGNIKFKIVNRSLQDGI